MKPMYFSTLVLFRSCFGSIRIAEFESVTTKLHPSKTILWKWDLKEQLHYGGDYGPSVIQHLPMDLTVYEWAEVARNCIGCKDVFQILGEGATLDDCIVDVGRLTDKQILKLIEGSWSMQVKMLGRSDRLHPKERRERVESFRNVLGVLAERTVKLNGPEHELILLEDYRRLQSDSTLDQLQRPKRVYLLLKITASKTASVRKLADLSDVKKRAFIGTTTLPAERALLMSNLGLVKEGVTILDPFCGSGGLLISSTLLGANVVGADVDGEQLLFCSAPIPFPSSPLRPQRGVEKVSYGDSFTELGLEQPTLIPGLDIQSDDFIPTVLQVNGNQKYNAIITDPPYGIRESSSKLSDRQITKRLCDVASQVLKPFGRLVFLRVVECDFGTLEGARTKLIGDLTQFSTQYGFGVSLLTMEKFNNRLWRATVVLTLQD